MLYLLRIKIIQPNLEGGSTKNPCPVQPPETYGAIATDVAPTTTSANGMLWWWVGRRGFNRDAGR
ncbi:hypothetical protein GCM10008094_24210 [Aidingimonas halophila]|nr:hypothetical protein GCM10008094_24210 [Aidingimonas halophila]